MFLTSVLVEIVLVVVHRNPRALSYKTWYRRQYVSTISSGHKA